MIKVEVKYFGKPLKLNESEDKIIEHIENYTIDEYKKAEEYYDSPQNTIRKEVTKIFRKFKGIFSVRFYV